MFEIVEALDEITALAAKREDRMANYTQDQIDSLQKAIATGVLSVEHNGTRTTYRSLDEMKKILQEMKDDVSGTRVRRTRAVYSGGA